ncbi:unnamed protein product [Symbiodinium necroappetens]|uniref:Exostosin GT47 domain-containing protein n=1 Tax=Symbiodinium necroappetens TaxID=1628268 RepID=A0A812TFM7_9DINO|nr:unnamed protein product [Symbiodinium necroappetens]
MPDPKPQPVPNADDANTTEEEAEEGEPLIGARPQVKNVHEVDVLKVQESRRRWSLNILGNCLGLLAGILCGIAIFVAGTLWEKHMMVSSGEKTAHPAGALQPPVTSPSVGAPDAQDLQPAATRPTTAAARTAATTAATTTAATTTAATTTAATTPVLPPATQAKLGLFSADDYRYPHDPSSSAFNAKAMECLRQTNPDLERFEYPADAEEHFEELNRTMSQFTKGVKPLCGKISAGYCGPWIENYWINQFSAIWKNRKNGTRLRDIFGPYIPIIFPFLDIFIPHFYRYPKGTLETLNQTLRPNVLYLAVSQCDDGIFGHWPDRKLVPFRQTDFPNMMVLSSGGYGHVPLPLFKQIEAPVQAAPLPERTYAVSFMGSLDHGPKGSRPTMKAMAERWGKLRNKTVRIGKGSDWKEVMTNTTLNLSPRGFGRNAYRTEELFQMGFIPVYIHEKGPWLFYRDLWTEEKIGFFSSPGGLESTLDHAFSDMQKLMDMERRIRDMRETHFMPLGVMDQISKFMTERDGGGDLRCEPLPDSII